MKLFVVIALFVEVCAAVNEWEEFKLTHRKQYKDEDEDARKQEVFAKNLEKIQEHNARFGRGEVSHRLSINKFADLTNEEFKSLYTGLKPKLTDRPSSNYTPKQGSLPDSVDWRKKNAVTPVKDQGACGSCWSFSTTGSMEGAFAIKSGSLIALSEQQLMDCSNSFGNQGCSGGEMDSAFNYIIKYGLESEQDYPYSEASQQCRYNASKVVTKAKSFVDISSGSEQALQEAVAVCGPVSIAIDASEPSFQFYAEGIYNEPSCSSDLLDHGVLAVGYGSEGGTEFWIVKNSWGPNWGESGYIRMIRNTGNQCGVATEASYPVL